MATLFIRVDGRNVPVALGDEAAAEKLVLEGAFAPALLPVVLLQALSVAEASVAEAEAKRVAKVAKRKETRAKKSERKHAARLAEDAEAGRVGAVRAAMKRERDGRQVAAKREKRRLDAIARAASARAAQQPPLGLGGGAHDVHECPGGCTGHFETRSHGPRSLAVHAPSCTGAGGGELRASVRVPREFSTAHATVAFLASAEMSGFRYIDGSESTILAYSVEGATSRGGRKQVASLGCRAYTRRPSGEQQAAEGQVQRVLMHDVMSQTSIAPLTSQHNSSMRRVRGGRTAYLQHTHPCFARATVYIVHSFASAAAATSSSSAAASASPTPAFPTFHFEVHVFDCHHSDCRDALASQPAVYNGATLETAYCVEQAKGNIEAAYRLHVSRCALLRGGMYGGNRLAPPYCHVCSRVPTPTDPAPLVSCSGYQCFQEGFTYCVACHSTAHLLNLEGVHRPLGAGDDFLPPPMPSTLPLSDSNFRLHAKTIADDGRRALMSSTFPQLSLLQALSACPDLREMHIGGKC